MKGIDIMYIYYFTKDIRRGNYILGDFVNEQITSYKGLIQEANRILKWNGETELTAKEIKTINRKELPPYDYYAVQSLCDGFGNDTYTETIVKTFEDAKNFVRRNNLKRNFKIVGGYFGGEYYNSFN